MGDCQTRGTAGLLVRIAMLALCLLVLPVTVNAQTTLAPPPGPQVIPPSEPARARARDVPPGAPRLVPAPSGAMPATQSGMPAFQIEPVKPADVTFPGPAVPKPVTNPN